MSVETTGSSPISTHRNSSSGMYLATTTRQTVSGVASTRPIGPHAHVQNATAMSRPTSDTPALRAYSSTSRMPLVKSSSTANSATTSNPLVQPGNTAMLTATGSPAPSQIPT